MRSKKALKNTVAGLLLQIVTIICGFILPRLILGKFGSSYNGITSSISQFISWVVLLRAGIGSVTRAALYKPLAEGDKLKVNQILKATDKFMKKISITFAGGLFIFALVYPFLLGNQFEWIFAFSLVIILGISTFVQNYFGITYQILLQADQTEYVYTILQIATIILNTIISAFLIKMNLSIHIVKLGSALVYILNPIFLNIYVGRKYKIDKNVEPDNSAIKQRWDAFAQQVATFVYNNTDLAVITIFTNIKEVSVYTVYYIVINGVWKLIVAATNGIDAAFGNMLAKSEKYNIQKNFKIYEFVNFTLDTIMFSTTIVLLVPFVMLYTKGVVDADYNRPIFGYILVFATWINCARLPYQSIVEAAGHFKQTKNGAIIEATLNICISLVLVQKYGIIGVAIGTLCASIFRTIQYSLYASKYILKRRYICFIKRIAIYLLQFLIVMYIFKLVPGIKIISYDTWILQAILVVFTSVFVSLSISIIFYGKDISNFINIINRLFKKII